MRDGENPLTSVCLGLEEICVVLTHIGYPDNARDLLYLETEGAITSEGASARLLAASHSLMSRGLLSVSDGGDVQVDDDLSPLILPMVTARRAIRLSRNDGRRETTRAFLFGDQNQVVQQDVDRDVAYRLAFVNEMHIKDASLAFFSGPARQLVDVAPFSFHNSVLKQIQADNATDQVARTLNACGLESGVSQLFVADLNHAEFRGNVLDILFTEEGPKCSRSLMVMGAPGRIWTLVLDARNGNEDVVVAGATDDIFSIELAHLVDQPRQDISLWN